MSEEKNTLLEQYNEINQKYSKSFSNIKKHINDDLGDKYNDEKKKISLSQRKIKMVQENLKDKIDKFPSKDSDINKDQLEKIKQQFKKTLDIYEREVKSFQKQQTTLVSNIKSDMKNQSVDTEKKDVEKKDTKKLKETDGLKNDKIFEHFVNVNSKYEKNIDLLKEILESDKEGKFVDAKDPKAEHQRELYALKPKQDNITKVLGNENGISKEDFYNYLKIVDKDNSLKEQFDNFDSVEQKEMLEGASGKELKDNYATILISDFEKENTKQSDKLYKLGSRIKNHYNYDIEMPNLDLMEIGKLTEKEIEKERVKEKRMENVNLEDFERFLEADSRYEKSIDLLNEIFTTDKKAEFVDPKDSKIQNGLYALKLKKDNINKVLDNENGISKEDFYNYLKIVDKDNSLKEQFDNFDSVEQKEMLEGASGKELKDNYVSILISNFDDYSKKQQDKLYDIGVSIRDHYQGKNEFPEMPNLYSAEQEVIDRKYSDEDIRKELDGDIESEIDEDLMKELYDDIDPDIDPDIQSDIDELQQEIDNSDDMSTSIDSDSKKSEQEIDVENNLSSEEINKSEQEVEDIKKDDNEIEKTDKGIESFSGYSELSSEEINKSKQEIEDVKKDDNEIKKTDNEVSSNDKDVADLGEEFRGYKDFEEVKKTDKNIEPFTGYSELSSEDISKSAKGIEDIGNLDKELSERDTIDNTKRSSFSSIVSDDSGRRSSTNEQLVDNERKFSIYTDASSNDISSSNKNTNIVAEESKSRSKSTKDSPSFDNSNSDLTKNDNISNAVDSKVSEISSSIDNMRYKQLEFLAEFIDSLPKSGKNNNDFSKDVHKLANDIDKGKVKIMDIAKDVAPSKDALELYESSVNKKYVQEYHKIMTSNKDKFEKMNDSENIKVENNKDNSKVKTIFHNKTKEPIGVIKESKSKDGYRQLDIPTSVKKGPVVMSFSAEKGNTGIMVSYDKEGKMVNFVAPNCNNLDNSKDKNQHASYNLEGVDVKLPISLEMYKKCAKEVEKNTGKDPVIAQKVNKQVKANSLVVNNIGSKINIKSTRSNGKYVNTSIYNNKKRDSSVGMSR